MPIRIQPWRQSVHRHASIALYRSLLSSSRKAGLDESRGNELKHAIRNKFKLFTKVDSKHHLAGAFGDGYNILRTLTASGTGDEAARSWLEAHLDGMSSSLKHPLQPRVTEKRTRLQPRVTMTAPPGYSIFRRPRPRVSGIRRVPKLVWASNYPMLRIKKPQPASVSRYLRQRLRTVFRWRESLAEQTDWHGRIAQYEDVWDKIVAREHGIRRSGLNSGADAESHTWYHDALEMRYYLEDKIRGELVRKIERGRRYKKIIEAETRLWKKERYQRRMERRRKRKKALAAGIVEELRFMLVKRRKRSSSTPATALPAAGDPPTVPEKRKRGRPRREHGPAKQEPQPRVKIQDIAEPRMEMAITEKTTAQPEHKRPPPRRNGTLMTNNAPQASDPPVVSIASADAAGLENPPAMMKPPKSKVKPSKSTTKKRSSSKAPAKLGKNARRKIRLGYTSPASVQT